MMEDQVTRLSALRERVIRGEYEVCAERLAFSEDDLRDITRTAIDAAFCDEELRSRLRDRL